MTQRDHPSHDAALSFAFDRDTSPDQPANERQGIWTGRVDPSWNIGDKPNGGYLASIAMRALRELNPAQQDPLSITTHYLRPGSAGEPCEVDAQVVRAGRTLSTVSATMIQHGKARLTMLGSIGDLGEPGQAAMTVPPPALPPPDQCIERSGAAQGLELNILKRLEIRLAPEHADYGEDRDAVISGWVRFRDGRAPDTHACLLFADAFPPAIFSKLGAVGWVPTIELTVHVRRRPAPGWVQARFETVDLNDGRLIETGMLWDEQGNLIAQARQLALLLT